MDKYLRGFIEMIRKMEKGNWNCLMGLLLKGNGIMGNCKGRVRWFNKELNEWLDGIKDSS